MNRRIIDRGWYLDTKQTGFNDFVNVRGMRQVDLPHDLTIESDVTPDAESGRASGYYKGGLAYYTKFITIPEDMKDQRILVEIDGSYMNTEVYCDGNFVKRHPYGYTPFHADITPYVKFGRETRLQVIVNNQMPFTSRWYTGSGIYRHVDILTAPYVHLSPWPVFAYTNRVEGDTAYITAEVTAENHTARPGVWHIDVELYTDEEGILAATGHMAVQIPAMGKRTGKVGIVVENAHLWDIDDPKLYKVKTVLRQFSQTPADSQIIDTAETLFGIRTISVDTKNGFMLNGRPLKLKGGCIHHTNGILGAVSLYDCEYRRVKLHKDNGFNAIRCAHNPPSRDFLEACDRLGIMVIDEAFDMFRMTGNPNDYHAYFETHWKYDVEQFITRDRSHPCIVLWSALNEVQERFGLSDGYAVCADVAEYIRKLDPTRPVTGAVCGTHNGLEDDDMVKVFQSWKEADEQKKQGSASLQNAYVPYGDTIWAARTEPFVAPLDVVGYNYYDGRYKSDHELFPNRIILGTESFPKDIPTIWKRVEECPHVIGDFTWTSMDYLGEAGLGMTLYIPQTDPTYKLPPVEYPWRSGHCGDFDLCGDDRAQLHLRKIVWGSDETYIFVHNPANYDKKEILSPWGFPDGAAEWTWNGFEGAPARVDVFSASPEVELFVNGISCGRKKAGKENGFIAAFDVKYEPGTIKAVSYDSSGNKVSEHELVTSGKAVKLMIEFEKTEARADGQSLVYATVTVADEEGRCVPFDDRLIKAEVSGAGRLLAFGSARPKTTENYTRGEFTSYLGRCQAIIRTGYDPGKVTLKVSSEGLGEAAAEFVTV
jgi:beta-galactosidase